MGPYILRRLVSSIPVLFLVTLISFSLMQLVPGDPAILVAGLNATPEEVERVREQLGLNQPFHVQLLAWYANLLRGDLGTSFLLGRDVLRGDDRAAAGLDLDRPLRARADPPVRHRRAACSRRCARTAGSIRR